ncbi:hypothetical protein Ae168Ps1_1345 [Pseudonocardia sp. Ae168_Ps1]|nr:hypothetical protein Ae150APs1_1341 [Pseudonocardia sp. Ae150A_Ps1]OLL78939.1 hypothetical protein Ae168Ps1_1345 [Pseudonocardia sp. Ae168_Ps1]OLL86923.1 hypothetical protein Ae263Ps1_3978c [Pseudonocardia sp. Ae263_Ps1]OLL93032.1 hypothetical protein Ae356Ps1_2929 [Pseudonocardia sp. Ae356_Ps1]
MAQAAPGCYGDRMRSVELTLAPAAALPARLLAVVALRVG